MMPRPAQWCRDVDYSEECEIAGRPCRYLGLAFPCEHDTVAVNKIVRKPKFVSPQCDCDGKGAAVEVSAARLWSATDAVVAVTELALRGSKLVSPKQLGSLAWEIGTAPEALVAPRSVHR